MKKIGRISHHLCALFQTSYDTINEVVFIIIIIIILKNMTEKLMMQRSNDAVRKEISSYNSLFEDSTTVDERKSQYKTLVTSYYSLSTDFYEYGWGRSFHFANRYHGETLAESLQRHESYLALKMQLKPGDKVLDIGCGVGGPLRRIASLTGAHITGLNISPYQIQRAKTIGKRS